MQLENFSATRIVVTAISFLSILSGCSGEMSGAGTGAGTDGDDTIEMTLTGSVGDGPIVGATVTIRDASDIVVATQTSDEFAGYTVSFGVPSGEFPLVLTVDDGLDLVTGGMPDFPLMAAIPLASDGQVANLTPMSTLAVKLARRMDGDLSVGNLAIANQTIRTALNFGLNTAQFSDPVSADVNDSNIANLVRSSEAFGEAIRRTRDALITIGQAMSAEQVLDALSADLVDGVLDGRGDAGVDPRVTVINNVVSAQVALETMANRLTVGGVRATNALDLAIQQVRAGNPNVALTGSVGVSDEILTQARVLLDAVIRIDSNPQLVILRAAIDLVEPGEFPSALPLPLPLLDGTSDVLEAVVQQVSVASAEDIDVVNDAVREGFDADGNNGNQVPMIAGDPASNVMVGSPYDFQPTAGDADNDILSFVIVGKPSWASFDPTTGRLSGTPVGGDEGSYVGIRISVSDGMASASLAAFEISVSGPSNGAPTIDGSPSPAVTVGTLYDFTPTTSDPDNDLLSFSIVGKPSWANFDQLTGRLWGTPDAGESGNYPGIRISVSDGSASATMSTFAILVSGLPNRAPSISGTAATQVTAGSAYSFTPTANDPDGDALTFSIGGKPSWASFNSGTGRLSGTPGQGDIGTFSGIGISVSDGSASATLAAFAITVNASPNGAPTIGGSPSPDVMVDSNYSFTPTASDPDNDPLTFSISGKPSWANFNTNTGNLSGTPAAGSAGTYPGIRISVSDGSATATLTTFTITVNALPNGVPTIGGSPSPDVMVGSNYNFTPTASDPDNDPLTFSISGKPSWASFNTNTGSLSGTPGAGAVGTYTGIQISVSDGVDSASLGSFSIEVIAQALGSATLSWDAPTQNEDGSPLTDLAGFKIYSGTSAALLTIVATINNPTVTTYLVENLNADTWFFKVTAFDSSTNESADSNIANKVVQP